MDATVAMDGLTRAHRDLAKPQNGLPAAPTRHLLVKSSTRGGGIFHEREWGNFE